MRNRLLITCVVLAVAALTASLFTVTAPPAEAQGTPGPTLGAYAQPIGNESNIDAFVKLEAQLGTTLPMIRAFAEWDDAIGADKPLHMWAHNGDRDLFVSVKPQRSDGSIITWRQVANAQPGSRIYGEMQALADGARRYPGQMILGFHHEPERSSNLNFGDSDDYQAAHRKLHAVFAAEGVSNVQWTWIMTEWSFEVETIRPNDRRVADKWYPGDAFVDIITSDPYNWNNCRGDGNDPWNTMEDELAPLLRFAAKHPGKQLALAEFASDEGTSGRKAQWINEARALFKTAPYRDSFVALMYFHDDGAADGFPNCDWWLDSSPSSINAAANWFQDPVFRSRLGATTQTPSAPVFCNNQLVTVNLAEGERPTGGDDIIRGTNGNDTISGLGGNDIICALGGNDTVHGGDGFDKVFAGAGNDTLIGGAGNDLLIGGPGIDEISGGNGNDRIQGGDGTDTLNGNNGVDRISGGNGNDILRGGASSDTLFGNLGNDQLFGEAGNDVLRGGAWRDSMNGGAGTNDGCTLTDPAGLTETRIQCESGVFNR